jgi:hypothetical protein
MCRKAPTFPLYAANLHADPRIILNSPQVVRFGAQEACGGHHDCLRIDRDKNEQSANPRRPVPDTPALPDTTGVRGSHSSSLRNFSSTLAATCALHWSRQCGPSMSNTRLRRKLRECCRGTSRDEPVLRGAQIETGHASTAREAADVDAGHRFEARRQRSRGHAAQGSRQQAPRLWSSEAAHGKVVGQRRWDTPRRHDAQHRPQLGQDRRWGPDEGTAQHVAEQPAWRGRSDGYCNRSRKRLTEEQVALIRRQRGTGEFLMCRVVEWLIRVKHDHGGHEGREPGRKQIARAVHAGQKHQRWLHEATAVLPT